MTVQEIHGEFGSHESPISLFGEWYQLAKESDIQEPSAVCLATSTKCGAPACRMVLLKDFDERGFVIYTNLQSRKSQHIIENPQAALCFFWEKLNRQVRVEGYVQNVTDEEADEYFSTRPIKSRIGAWASLQSEPMESNKELLKKVAHYTAKWATTNIKRPPFWSGFRIIPDYLEFWKQDPNGAPNRLAYVKEEAIWKPKPFETPLESTLFVRH